MFVQDTSSKFTIIKARNMFELEMSKSVVNMNFINFNLWFFYYSTLWSSQNFKTNSAYLIFKKYFWKKFVYIGVLSALNMQKDFRNFINLPQIFIIEMLLVMEFIPKEKMTIQTIVFVWRFSKDIMIECHALVSTPLCDTYCSNWTSRAWKLTSNLTKCLNLECCATTLLPHLQH
jgi:hypothetical protein